MAIRTKSAPVEFFTCDDCGIEAQAKYLSIQLCSRCGRHACTRDGHYDLRLNEYDEEYPGDWFCKPCWSIGEPFREQLAATTKSIDEQWTAACMAAKKQRGISRD
jgi:hypothetical protein